MNEPTDAELDALCVEISDYDDPAYFRVMARAVLAKWGTPPAVAGEPVAKERFSEPLARVIYAGYLLSNCAFNLAQRPGTEISIGTAQTLSDCRKEWDEACAAYKALPSTPQPTQAQAGAPRVSPEQWQALFDAQKRLVELANSRADIAERLLKAVQAQAGAVPLTPEQIAEGFAKRSRHIGLFAGGARFAEQHHGIGIKGGQHG